MHTLDKTINVLLVFNFVLLVRAGDASIPREKKIRREVFGVGAAYWSPISTINTWKRTEHETKTCTYVWNLRCSLRRRDSAHTSHRWVQIPR